MKKNISVQRQRKERIASLLERWELFNEQLCCDLRIELPQFKRLFTDTWRFFMEEETNDALLSRESLPLATALVPIIYLNNYPEGVGNYTFDACVIYAKGLLRTICNPNLGYYHFRDGYIVYYVYMHCPESFQHIDSFSEDLDKLSYELWEEADDGEEFVL